MRTVVSAGFIALVMTTPAAAVTLETAAQVRIVAAAEASLESVDPSGTTAWNLTGTPGDHLQLSVELRSPTGECLSSLPATTLSLGTTGQALATLDAPAVSACPYDALPVVTLVICRE